jgi:hypothetical protein
MMHAQTNTETYHHPFSTSPRISLRIEILYTASWNNVTGGPWISESAERRKEKLEAISYGFFLAESPTCMIGNNTTLCATCDTNICDANPLAGRHKRVPVQPIGVAVPASESTEALLFAAAAEEKANANKLDFCSQTLWTRFSAKTSLGSCTRIAFCLTTDPAAMLFTYFGGITAAPSLPKFQVVLQFHDGGVARALGHS